MCLILFAHEIHPEFPLVIAANRDEFYSRPTETAKWWETEPGLLGGRDLIGGGSWFGVNRQGKFAAITNVREPERFNTEAPSRGPLVTDYLLDPIHPKEYFEKIRKSGKEYNGFNLLLGFHKDIYYFSNRSEDFEKLAPGVYGLSNHLLDTPWPKVEKGKTKLKKALGNGQIEPDQLFDDLLDKDQAPDKELPATGVPLEWERGLSAMFIELENYGTRCSTLLLRDRDDQIYFEERSYIPENSATYRFKL
jgi:uncharacterized protein with NRDE domain